MKGMSKKKGIWFSLALVFAILMSCTITDRLRELREGAEAIATSVEVGGQLMETGEAFITEVNVEEIEETLQAVATEVEIPELSGEKPEDIPVMQGDVGDLVTSAEVVSYFISEKFDVVVDFYKREMPLNGWTLTKEDVGSGFAELTFEKGTRKATVVITEIPFLEQTTVVINIEG